MAGTEGKVCDFVANWLQCQTTSGIRSRKCIGQVNPSPDSGQHAGAGEGRGGTPARKGRRQRRKSERQAKATEEVTDAEGSNLDCDALP